MKARHVWVIFAFVLGTAMFADSIYEHGITWGLYDIIVALKVGAISTAGVLAIVAFILTWVEP